MSIFIQCIFAYIIGSIPSGLIIGKYFYNKDLRQYGSKNIGATNAYRVLGKLPAFIIFLLDLIKGVCGVMFFAPQQDLMLLGGVLAILGHNCSIFLSFKGGKGVATGLGVIASLSLPVAGIAFLIWSITVWITRYVSLGSILAAMAVPLAMLYWQKPLSYIIFGILTALFIIIKHKSNINRLINGNELKVERIKTK